MSAPTDPIPPASPGPLRLAGHGDPADAAAPRGPAGPDTRVLSASERGMALLATVPGRPDSILCVTVISTQGSGLDRRLTLHSIDGPGLARTQDRIRRCLVAGRVPPGRLGRR
jgi:hypothetical protein